MIIDAAGTMTDEVMGSVRCWPFVKGEADKAVLMYIVAAIRLEVDPPKAAAADPAIPRGRSHAFLKGWLEPAKVEEAGPVF
jgi:hypothetical protein